MNGRVLGVSLGLLIGGAQVTAHRVGHAEAPTSGRVDAERVARLPYPGTVTPGAIGFTPDGRALTYLKAESSDSLSRVLWRADVEKPEPRVVARPPGGGDTDVTVSKEEALRRERQRLRETGITQIVRAENADVTVIPIGGDLYVQRSSGPLERLTDSTSPEIDPQPSADGAKVAFVRENELYVIDVATKQERQLTRGATDGLAHGLAEFIAQEELNRFTGFWWSPDGKLLAYQETDERHIPLYTITHQGGDAYSTESHRYPFAGAANARVRLGVVAVDGGETRWLGLAPPDTDFYLARVQWETEGQLLVQVLSRAQNRLILERIDVSKDDRHVLIEETSGTWIDLHDDLRCIKGTGELLWSSERSGFRQLELRDSEGKLVRVLTSDPWPVDGVVELDTSRRELWYAASGPNPTEAHLFRVSLDGGPPMRITRAAGTHRAVVARDGNHVVLTSSDLKAPPRTVLRDREGQVVATLDDAAADARIDDLDLSPPELVSFPNRDGVTLHGAYYAPRSRALGAKAPLIVMVYGGPTVQLVADAWAMTADLNAQYLAGCGFAVWKCDNRGSSRRGRDFQSCVHHSLGTVEVHDQVDGVRFLAAHRPEIDPARVGITGGSYGGYMTLRCLELAGDLFKAGVAVAPVTDWDGYDTAYTERYMGMPKDNPDGYSRASVLAHAESLAGRLLVVHGMLDENVHFRHTARLATALIHANKPYELLPLPDERHSSRRIGDRRYVAERMSQFLATALREE